MMTCIKIFTEQIQLVYYQLILSNRTVIIYDCYIREYYKLGFFELDQLAHMTWRKSDTSDSDMWIYPTQFQLLLYRLPYFSHVPMSDYFTFQTTDISIRYRLLQKYNKFYKTVSKLANLLQLLGSIMSRMYLMLISRYYSLRIYQYQLSQNSPIICCFRLPI